MTIITSNNPGVVNVADQADGPLSVDQSVRVGPSTNSGPTERGLDYADGPVTTDQAVTVTPPMTARLTVDAGVASPLKPGAVSVTPNNVDGKLYGIGTPVNVYV